MIILASVPSFINFTLSSTVIIIIDHDYKPDSHLTMKALVTLEWGMNVPVLTKLQSNLGDLIKLTDERLGRPTRDSEPEWADFMELDPQV